MTRYRILPARPQPKHIPCDNKPACCQAFGPPTHVVFTVFVDGVMTSTKMRVETARALGLLKE